MSLLAKAGIDYYSLSLPSYEMEKADKFSFIPGDSDDEIIEDEADDPEMRTVSIRHIGSCNRIRVCIVKREVFASGHTPLWL